MCPAGCTEHFGSWPKQICSIQQGAEGDYLPSNQQKKMSCQETQCLITVLMCVQNNLVKMVNEFMDRRMVSKGFYPSMPDYQACVLQVLGKENLPAAKQNLKEYLAIIEMVSCCVD